MRNLNYKVFSPTVYIDTFFNKKNIYTVNKACNLSFIFMEFLVNSVIRYLYLLRFFFYEKGIYFIDSFVVKPYRSFSNIFYAFNFFFIGCSFLAKKRKTKNSYIVTTCTLWLSSSWVERELSEFSEIYVISTIDSRRLLTDYTQKKLFIKTHEPFFNNYSNSFTDILL